MFFFTQFSIAKDTSGWAILSQPVSGAGRVHQRVAVVRRRGTLSVGLRRIVRILHAPVVHAPRVQRGAGRGRHHRGRVVRADRAVVPAVPVHVPVTDGRRHSLPGTVNQGIGNGSHGGRVRGGLLT